MLGDSRTALEVLVCSREHFHIKRMYHLPPLEQRNLSNPNSTKARTTTNLFVAVVVD